MRNITIRRCLCLVLTTGLCLCTLSTTGAADWAVSPEIPPAAPSAVFPEPLTPEDEVISAAEAAARWKRADTLLSQKGLTPGQRESLSGRMGADALLLERLEQGTLSQTDLVYLALPNSRTDRLDRYAAWSASHPEDTAEAAVLQVNMDQDQAFYSLIWEVADPSSLTVLVNKHYTLPAGYVPELEALGKNYGSGFLRPEAAQAFRALADAARADGVVLRSVSAYRSYKQQASTYNRYLRQYQQSTVDTFSARPGHSEHQTGLALDINVASSQAHFENTPAFAWLKAHCAEYGFILRYDLGKDSITGYRFEPWHYRYVGQDAAKVCMEQGITYEEYVSTQPVWSAAGVPVGQVTQGSDQS